MLLLSLFLALCCWLCIKQRFLHDVHALLLPDTCSSRVWRAGLDSAC
jgi:hypothetical protein